MTASRKAMSGGEFAGMGVAWVAVVLMAAAAGRWLDLRVGTTPWLMILIIFVAAAGGFYGMYRRGVASQAQYGGRGSGSDVPQGPGGV